MRRLSAGAVLCAALAWAGPALAGPAGTLVVAQSIDDIVSLDPAEGFELSSVQAFTSLYQRLEQPDPDPAGGLRPTLAESVVAGADGHSLEYTLRAGARFASGRPVRPEDVVFSLVRAVKLNRNPAFILNGLGWTADNVEGFVSIVDARRVRVRWPAKAGPTFARNVLTAPVASIVDREEILAHAADGDLGNGWLHQHSAGSGPFKVRTYIARQALVLDANPDAPGGGPLLKTLVIKNVADAASRRLLVEVGDADIARDLGPDQVAALRGRPEITVLSAPSAAVHYLLFNGANPDNPALRNPALWEAARWLVDYEGIAHDLLKDQYFVHQAFLPQGYAGALAATPYRLDAAKAREILARGGLGGGAEIELDVFNQPPFPDIAQSLQASFAQAGIRLRIRPAVASEIYARTRTRAVQAVWLYWIPDYSDPHSTASAFALNRDDGTKTVAWRAGWQIPELSARTEAALQEGDPAKRQRLYEAIQAEVQRRSPFVFALQERAQLVMRSDVRGYRQGLNADMVYYDRVSKSR